MSIYYIETSKYKKNILTANQYRYRAIQERKFKFKICHLHTESQLSIRNVNFTNDHL